MNLDSERALAINHLQLAVLSALFGAVLAVGSHFGPVPLLIAIALVQAVLIPCWVLGTGLPGRIGGLVLGVLAAAGADAATLHWHDSGYSPVLGVLGLAVPLMFVHQLTRGVVRTRVVESMAAIAVLVVGVVALSGLLVLRRQGNGETITVALVAAIAVGLVVDHLTDAVLPAPRFDPAIDRGLPAVLAGVVAGGLVGLLLLRQDIDFAGGRGPFLGAAVAAVGCLLSIGATFAESRDQPAAQSDDPDLPTAATALPREVPAGLARLRPAAAVALTIALTAPAAYVLTNALTG
ncbi:MAG TPA: hypothetical protein VFD94_00535 [Jatrophihabitans sp.]|nr:hypothetical protein [Jatrophihabitans sp.]